MKNLPDQSGLGKEQIHTALLLAAGTGSRLAPLTDHAPKCLVSVDEISILERLVDALHLYNFKRLVIVIGHEAHSIRDFLSTRAGDMEITYITSPVYKTTNNIYSLWLARKELTEPFLLIESDLIFDPEMLKDMLTPDRIAVSKLQPWMNGTTVTINRHRTVKAFQKDVQKPGNRQYKTVNIYSLSTHTWKQVRKRLDHHISKNMVNGYYETIFADMVTEDCLSFAPVFFDADRWYEIDTLTDLRAAAHICSLYHQPAAHIPDYEANEARTLDLPLFSKRRPAPVRKKGGSRHNLDSKVPSSILPVVPLVPQPVQ
jgi:choline kinase